MDNLGSGKLPSGRYVSATIQGDVSINLIGVCIPWKDAHVNSGRRDRKVWEDHSRYLSALNEMALFSTVEKPTIVFGDFNQRMSGKYARKDVHEQLMQTFGTFEIPTGKRNAKRATTCPTTHQAEKLGRCDR